jgi:dolichyl-phosphate-mannose-protein mannosyltransferase
MQSANANPTNARGTAPRRSWRLHLAVIAGLVVVGALVRWPWLAEPGHGVDPVLFAAWAGQMQQGTWADAYVQTGEETTFHAPSNYPPGWLYVWRGCAAVFTLATGRTLNETVLEQLVRDPAGPLARTFFVVFKTPAVVVDLLTGAALYLLLRRRVAWKTAAVVAALYLLQPGVIYNSARWGQVDAGHTLLMVLALELAARRRYVWTSVAAAAALLFKFQAVLLAPVWAIALVLGDDRDATATRSMSLRMRLRRIDTGARARRIGLAVTAAVLVVAAGVLPFIATGGASGVWHAYGGAVGTWPGLTANAFNLWGVLAPLHDPDPSKSWQPDNVPWHGITGRQAGFALLGAATVLVAWRLIRRPITEAALRWAAVALCLSFFTFPTQIHERYLHPVLAIMAWAFVPRAWWWCLWLVLGWVYAINILWVLPFRPDWIGAAAVQRVTEFSVGTWPPSVLWGSVITAATLAVLMMPPRAWKQQKC